MKISFFTIPIRDPKSAGNELNTFLRGHRIVSVDKQFVADGSNSCWVFCIEWLDADESSGGRASVMKSRVDYKQELSEDDFIVYARLRDLRKEIADKEGVPPFVVFTNAQLADIVKQCIISKAGLLELKGVGKSRVDKYGDMIIKVMKDLFKNTEKDETNQD